VQKFTRSLTREIEIAGERLALTLSEQGLAVRPVGSRKPPRELSWAAILCELARQAEAPAPEEVAAAVQWVKTTKAAPAPAPAKAPSSDIAGSLTRLDRWFAEHRSRYHGALALGAGAAELEALQNVLGIPVPGDLAALLAWHNGQSADFVGAFEQSWHLMSTQQIAEAKRELDTSAGELGWKPDWIPFLEDDAGDFVCVDTSQSGAPVRAVWRGQPEHPVIAPSLAAWLEEFATAVEQGRYVEDSERGTFLRKRE
jgi:cell wall assembly regulator SMI1